MLAVNMWFLSIDLQRVLIRRTLLSPGILSGVSFCNLVGEPTPGKRSNYPDFYSGRNEAKVKFY